MDKFVKISGIAVVIMLSMASCKKFISVSHPSRNNFEMLFDNDSSANSAVIGIYEQLSENSGQFLTGNRGISLLAGLSCDEFDCYSGDHNLIQFYTSSLTSSNDIIIGLWNNIYKCIHVTNAVIEGLNNNNFISQSLRQQLQGEALFLRGYLYFTLINLYGPVPLALSTDHRINGSLSRSSESRIYERIISDLLKAERQLPEFYPAPYERIRANRAAATALLSRVFLYRNEDLLTLQYASQVIGQISQYQLCTDIEQTFIKNSSEAILQIAPVSKELYFWDADVFIFHTKPTKAALAPSLVKAFDTTDLRLKKWVGYIDEAGERYHYPFKYKYKSGQSIQDYLMLLRLSEQYLNRAEAYARLGRLDSSAADLNRIRLRAGLLPYHPTNSSELIQEIFKERRKELFSELGHRWFDLKRSGKADSVLQVAKGTRWQTTDILYPIPNIELLLNGNLSQNEGY